MDTHRAQASARELDIAWWRAAPRSRAAERPLRLVIADDEPIALAGMTAMAQGAGLTVAVAARDCQGALAAARQHRPDIVLVDLALGAGDGLDVVRGAVALGLRAACVVISKHDRDDRLSAAMAAGARAFLRKDMEAGEIVAAIHGAHAGQTVLHGGQLERLVRCAAWPEAGARTGPAATAAGTASRPAGRGSALRMLPAAHRVSPVQDRRPAGEPAPAVGSLTERELDVLAMLIAGASNGDIARELVISMATVKSHVSSVLRKLNICRRSQAGPLLLGSAGLLPPAGRRPEGRADLSRKVRTSA